MEHGSELKPVQVLIRGSRDRRESQTAEQQLVFVDFNFPHLGKGLCLWYPPTVAQVGMGWGCGIYQAKQQSLYQTRFAKQVRVWVVVGALLAK